MAKKQSSPDMQYVFNCPKYDLVSKLHTPSHIGDWILRFVNRDMVDVHRNDSNEISDAFVVKCDDKIERNGHQVAVTLWYLSELDGYLYSISSDDEFVEDQLVDVAYEQFSNSLYVIFKGDSCIYKYDNIEKMKDSSGWVFLSRDNSNMKIDTFHSMQICDGKNEDIRRLCIDYVLGEDERVHWSLKIYGQTNGIIDVETWSDNPGQSSSHFMQDNVILFGDSLFSPNQLKFQNISKNKEMFDILDIQEVDGYYYGLFKDDRKSRERGKDTYTIFKCPMDEQTIDKLPFDVIIPKLYVTSDELYSLYVVTEENGRVKLQELSVPNSDPYVNRKFDIVDVFKCGCPKEDEKTWDDIEVKELMMDNFITDTVGDNSYIFSLSNKGFHEIKYSIDIY